MPGETHKAVRKVGVTAPTGSVRGFFRPRPWTKPSGHGRIAAMLAGWERQQRTRFLSDGDGGRAGTGHMSLAGPGGGDP
jgi:hypothetical protein